MRIDDLNRTPVTAGTDKTDATTGARNGAKDGATPTSADQADVSTLARALASGDAQRLEQLRLQVQSGNYNVSAEAVAKAIIDAHLGE